MKRFVLIQGNQIGLYLDGKLNGVWIWRIEDGEKATEIIEYVRLHGDKL